jgi:hypothetical protein
MSTEVEKFDPAEFGNVGMEDVAASDLIVPRLQLDHKKAVFRDSLSKEEFTDLRVVILGLVKQRIMWDDDVEEGDKPQCKSPDFENGFPQMRTDIPYPKQFPWDRSNFRKEDFPPEAGINNLITLPCNSCVFQQWGKDPRSGKATPPPCSEQHTYPLLYTTDDSTWTVAIATFQRTGIKPSKNYISSFAQSNMPMFTSFTTLSLNAQSRGSVEYAVPVFRKGEQTDRGMWPQYADQYRQIRGFIRSAPRNQQEDNQPAAPANNVNSAPQGQPVVQQPAAQPEPVVAPQQYEAPPMPQQGPPPSAPDDDLPF